MSATEARKRIPQNYKSQTVNEIWKSLDIIFQIQLRTYCEDSNIAKFHELAAELGFNDKQRAFLCNSLDFFIKDVKSSKSIIVNMNQNLQRNNVILSEPTRVSSDIKSGYEDILESTYLA